jgi:hypothetical protein
MRRGRKDGCAEQTHKPSKPINFVTPPSTMNTATAKFTMRLHTQISPEPSNPQLCPSQPRSLAASSPGRTHKMSEKSMLADGSERCGNRSLTGGWGKMEETARRNGRVKMTLCRGWMMGRVAHARGRKLARAGVTAKPLGCACWGRHRDRAR